MLSFPLPLCPNRLFSFLTSCLAAMIIGLSGFAALQASESATVGNTFIERTVSWEAGLLATQTLSNRLGDTQADLSGGDEFALTVRLPAADMEQRTTAVDFAVVGSQINAADGSLNVELTGKTIPLDIVVRYVAKPGERWMRKQLLLTAREPMQLRSVAVEHLVDVDAYTPYQADQLTAQGRAQWRPPLGQPIYTKSTGFWWGVEFPAARNEVQKNTLVCGYQTAVDLKPGETWSSHPVAVGVADDPAFVKEAFLDYIDATRARPLRLQTQYNSWFDYHRGVNSENFAASVRKLHEELVVGRGVPPLSAYVIDDGWQDVSQNWAKVGVWPENDKFANNFKQAREAVAQADSSLGLWLSPGCLFGGQRAIRSMAAAGWRSLDPWMSMTGPRYMDALETRMVELAASRVAYFKLDGVFGHLIARNFDINGFRGSEQELNDARYDEEKERYLSLGSERLIEIFRQMDEANPDVYIVISNGAFLSPWWLQHVDTVWMINAGDAAKGADRTGELVYRDAVYYQLASENGDNAQFPLNSIFNHEPKKTSSGESADVFRRYLLMNLSRGTGFVELYLKTFQLSESDWDVLAEGMKWAHRVFPAFKRARMLGGDPAEEQTYGYTGWTDNFGYLSLHNPSDEPREFEFVLDRAAGLPAAAVNEAHTYGISTPVTLDAELLPETATAGKTCSISLPPRAIRILEFHRTAANDSP